MAKESLQDAKAKVEKKEAEVTALKAEHKQLYKRIRSAEAALDETRKRLQSAESRALLQDAACRTEMRDLEKVISDIRYYVDELKRKTPDVPKLNKAKDAKEEEARKLQEIIHGLQIKKIEKETKVQQKEKELRELQAAKGFQPAHKVFEKLNDSKSKS